MSIRKLLLALLLGLGLQVAAEAATTTHEVATGDTTQSPNTSAAYTPADNALTVVFINGTATVDNPPTVSNSDGLTFTHVIRGLWSTSANSCWAFVSNELSNAVSQTVTVTTAGDDWTGTAISVVVIEGVTRVGLDAILQSGNDENNASGATPLVTFGSNVNTNNVTLGAVCNGTNPATITPPTGWTEDATFGDIGFATPDAGIETVYRNSGYTGTTMTWGSTFGSNGAAVGLEIDTSAEAAAPAFNGAVVVNAAANGYDVDYEVTEDATLYTQACNPGDAAPNQAEAEAGQCGGGNAALFAASEAATADTPSDIALTEANNPPRMDVYTTCSNEAGDCTLDTDADEDRSARSGFEITALTSVSATGICDLDAYFDPDCASGDVFENEAASNENAGCTLDVEADGDLVFNEAVSGDCGGPGNRRTFQISYQDYSSATTGLFTAPSVGNFTTDDTIYLNNSAPACDPEEAVIVVLLEDAAMDTVDVGSIGACHDDDSDVLSYSVTSGTLPVGTSLGGTGNKDWSGTPTTENEAGAAITIQACDVADDCDTYNLTSYVVSTFTVPDLSGLTESAGEAALIVAAPWRSLDSNFSVSGTECSEETAGTIIGQSPAASAEAGALDAVTVTLAVDCGDPATERKVVFVLTDLTGLVRWVDFIPVSVVVGCDAGRYEENGCWATLPLASDSGKVAWVDYIPVGEVSPDETGKWRYENNGWIPVDDLTP